MAKQELQGWILLYRELQTHTLWLAEPFTKGQAWVDLLLKARHSAGAVWIRGIEVRLKRGQLAWSEVTMAKRWKWSRNKVRRFLKWLETEQQIKQTKLVNITSITTILNYDRYQSNTTKKTPSDTAKGQQKDSKRYINNNGNNEKKEKKKNSSTPSVRTDQHIINIIDAFKEFGVNKMVKGWYANKAQRAACQELVDVYGEPQVIRVIQILTKSNQKTYIPTATTPCQLRDKWSAIEAGLLKIKNNQNGEKRQVI